MVKTSSPSRCGCCKTPGGGSGQNRAPRIPRVGGHCRNVARAITTHCFGLWAVDGATRKLGQRYPDEKRPFMKCSNEDEPCLTA